MKVSAKKVEKYHLVEYRNLIIWMLKNKANFRGYMNLVECMNEILADVEAGKVTYKTVRGLKGVICRHALSVGLANAEKNMREKNGISVLAGAYDNAVVASYQQFRINALM